MANKDEVARSAIEVIFYSLNLARVELLAEPNHPEPHKRMALQTFGNRFCLLLAFTETEMAPRAAGDENVAVNLDHLFFWQAISFPLGARMEIIHVLSHE